MDIDAESWDIRLDQDDFYLTSRWLGLVEDNVQTPVRYAVLADGERIEAGLPTVIADINSPWVLGRPDGILEEARRAGQSLPEALSAQHLDSVSLLPSLVCGGRHMGPTRVAGSRDTEQIRELLAWALQYAASADVASISFPFVDEGDAELRRILGSGGYHGHLSAEYAILDLPVGGWDAYLASLPGKRRRRVLADARQLQASDVTSRMVPLSECNLPELGRLEAQLMSKYGVDWSSQQTVVALESAIRRFGDGVSVVLSEIHGTLVGFVVLHRWRDSWYTRQAGFSYDVPEHPPLYFETMYYRPIREAEGLGVKRIFFGSGSEEAKQSRGCILSRQYQYIKLLAN